MGYRKWIAPPTSRLVDATKLDLNETSAKEALYSLLQRLLLEGRETLRQLGDALARKDPKMAGYLRAEYGKVHAEVQKVVKDLEKMKVPLPKRLVAALFFREKAPSRKTELNLIPGELDNNKAG